MYVYIYIHNTSNNTTCNVLTCILEPIIPIYIIVHTNCVKNQLAFAYILNINRNIGRYTFIIICDDLISNIIST